MDKSDRIPSNSEVVDSIINDFKETCNIKDDCESGSGNKPSPSDKEPPEDSPPDWPRDGENGDSETVPKPKPEDYIDEEEQKSREESLTEEELLRLKNEAEELKVKGNEQFKSQDFKESSATYTLALRTSPLAYPKERAILYANRAAAKVKLEQTEAAIDDCSKAIELEPNYLKALLRRAQLYDSSEKWDEALADFQKIVEIDPSHGEARAACQRLPVQIKERNEKMMGDLMGKLKDLGNIVLRPFGLSTNNFQMVQDPNSGGYSINFKQN